MSGLEPAKKFILNAIAPILDNSSSSELNENYKSTLQQHAQRYHSATPHYETLDEQGPDHSKCFEVCVVLNGIRYQSAWGASKKQAEQNAAQKALNQLLNRPPQDP